VLVLDASVVLQACLVDEGFERFGDPDQVAPPFMWAEVRSALHEAVWRGELAPSVGAAAATRLDAGPVSARSPARVGESAWRIADELGWAKTYDAEYVATASLLDCRLVTADKRLLRSTAHLGRVVSLAEL